MRTSRYLPLVFPAMTMAISIAWTLNDQKFRIQDCQTFPCRLCQTRFLCCMSYCIHHWAFGPVTYANENRHIPEVKFVNAKLMIFDAFMLLIRKKNVANYALLRCKTFSLKIWLCKILDKYHVCLDASRRIMRPHQNICCLFQTRVNDFSSQSKYTHTQSYFQFVACSLVWKIMVFTKGLEARNIFSSFPFFEAFDLKDQRN